MTRRLWCLLIGMVPFLRVARAAKPPAESVVVGNSTVTLTARGVLVVSEGAGLEIPWR